VADFVVAQPPDLVVAGSPDLIVAGSPDPATMLWHGLPTVSQPALIVLVVILAVIGEMAGVVGVQIGASRRYDGPLGKSDRAFAFGLLGLLLGCGVPRGTWVTVFLAVLVALAALTVVNRARRALREVA